MSAPRILVVEDEGLQAMTIEDMLEDLGCEVAASLGTVAEAMAWLEAGEALDGALLDVSLDGHLVYPVAEILAARRVPFAFTSGYGQLGERRFEFALALVKPVSRAALLRALRSFGLAV